MENPNALWDMPIPQKDSSKGRLSLRETLIQAGNKRFNVDKLIRSEYGERFINGFMPIFLSENPMDERVITYWHERGLEKKRIAGSPNKWDEWTIFTPVDMEKGKLYPLLIALHGGAAGPGDGETVFMAESSGYARKAAEEKFILALPEDHSTEAIYALYQHMVQEYPVEKRRVYLVGFSAGGDRACSAAIRYPELFAGICVGAGLPFSLSSSDDEIDRASKYGIPTIAIGCLDDKGNHTPFCVSNPIDNHVPEFIERILSAQGKIGWANTFFRINDIEYMSLSDTVAYLSDKGTEEERIIGLSAPKSWSYWWGGLRHYCLGYNSRKGVDCVRYVFIEGLPHVEPTDMMDIAWDYLKSFQR